MATMWQRVRNFFGGGNNAGDGEVFDFRPEAPSKHFQTLHDYLAPTLVGEEAYQEWRDVYHILKLVNEEKYHAVPGAGNLTQRLRSHADDIQRSGKNFFFFPNGASNRAMLGVQTLLIQRLDHDLDRMRQDGTKDTDPASYRDLEVRRQRYEADPGALRTLITKHKGLLSEVIASEKQPHFTDVLIRADVVKPQMMEQILIQRGLDNINATKHALAQAIHALQQDLEQHDGEPTRTTEITFKLLKATRPLEKFPKYESGSLLSQINGADALLRGYIHALTRSIHSHEHVLEHLVELYDEMYTPNPKIDNYTMQDVYTMAAKRGSRDTGELAAKATKRLEDMWNHYLEDRIVFSDLDMGMSQEAFFQTYPDREQGKPPIDEALVAYMHQHPKSVITRAAYYAAEAGGHDTDAHAALEHFARHFSTHVYREAKKQIDAEQAERHVSRTLDATVGATHKEPQSEVIALTQPADELVEAARSEEEPMQAVDAAREAAYA